jgi:hypothetical protein
VERATQERICSRGFAGASTIGSRRRAFAACAGGGIPDQFPQPCTPPGGIVNINLWVVGRVATGLWAWLHLGSKRLKHLETAVPTKRPSIASLPSCWLFPQFRRPPRSAC